MQELFFDAGTDCRALDPAVGPDTMAVLGAMLSRAPNLIDKWNALVAEVLTQTGGERLDFRNPPPRIVDFLRQNVGDYNHASIASMAKSVLVYVHGFGWPSAWLLEDFPLFDGQEVSTRAIDATKIVGVNGPRSICRYAPASLQALHDGWLNAYDVVKRHLGGGAWRYDDARVFLPGTIPSGVVLTQDVRAIARQLDHIAGLGGSATALAEQVYQGLDALAPIMTAQIGRKSRRPFSTWAYGIKSLSAGTLTRHVLPGDLVRVNQWDGFSASDWEDLMIRIEPREGPSRHLDPAWRQAPRFHVSIPCSIACARDFHRHRPSMPWSFKVITETTPQGGERVAMAPWYHVAERVGEDLLDATTEQFRLLGGFDTTSRATGDRWAALHALPFAALIQLEAVMTLPDIVYMFELRYAAAGANAEYRAQAEAGLRQLAALVPKAVVEAEHLDGVLHQGDLSHPV